MSRFILFASRTLEADLAKLEKLATWGDEEFRYDLPRYELGSLRFEQFPVPEHYRDRMCFDNGNEVCFAIDQAIVYAWDELREQDSFREEIRSFLAILVSSSDWVAIYESDRGEGVREIRSAPKDIFEHVDEVLQKENDQHALTVITPVSGASGVVRSASRGGAPGRR